ncbi:MAG TPA: hypothetical protein VJM34_08425 [Novosphingobium sp.]|nr:hypothetical protein [Novosphingobium sp.]
MTYEAGMLQGNVLDRPGGHSEFAYILDKIRDADFSDDPFRHVIIDEFLSPEHFAAVTSAPEVSRKRYGETEEMLNDLLSSGYKVQEFPGCITSVPDYLKFVRDNEMKGSLVEGYGHGLLEGYGMTLRLMQYQSPILEGLIAFLNTEEFRGVIADKFGVTNPTYPDTSIQKYLTGYEISPHPDTRKKALTYMLNINTDRESEDLAIHTYLLEFAPERKYVYDLWRHNLQLDRCWVPWSWCEPRKQTNRNNSIVIFRPSDDTLHAVKLNYDHLKFQRTQVYGNLWYHEKPYDYSLAWQDIDVTSKAAAVSGRKRNLVQRGVAYLNRRLNG